MSVRLEPEAAAYLQSQQKAKEAATPLPSVTTQTEATTPIKSSPDAIIGESTSEKTVHENIGIDKNTVKILDQLSKYTPPEGYKVVGYQVMDDAINISLAPDPDYLRKQGFTENPSTGEFIAPYLPPAYSSALSEMGLTIGQGQKYYKTAEGWEVREFRINPSTGGIRAVAYEPAKTSEGFKVEDYQYKGFMSVDQAGGIGTDPVILSTTEAMGKSTLITPVSVQLLKFSDTLPKGNKVLESSFADVSGAGGIGTDPEITGKTPVYSGDIAKGAVNFAAGLAAWGESFAFAPTLPGFSKTAERYPGYTFGTLAPDIVMGAKFVSDIPGMVSWARVKLFGDPKVKAYENLIKDADPLTKIQLDEAVRARDITTTQKTYRVAAYSDPLSTAGEDRLLWMRDYAGKPRPVFPNEKPASPREYFRPSVNIGYDAKAPSGTRTTYSQYASTPKPSATGGGGAVAQELRMDEKTLQAFSKTTVQSDYAKSAARSMGQLPVKGATIGVVDVVPKIVHKPTLLNRPVSPTEHFDTEVKIRPTVVPIDLPKLTPVPDPVPFREYPIPKPVIIEIPDIIPDIKNDPKTVNVKLPKQIAPLKVGIDQVQRTRWTRVPPAIAPPPVRLPERKKDHPIPMRRIRFRYVEDVNPFGLELVPIKYRRLGL